MSGNNGSLTKRTISYRLITLYSVAAACIMLAVLELYLKHRAEAQPVSEMGSNARSGYASTAPGSS